MRIGCRIVRQLLATGAGEAPESGRVAVHLSGCLHCQAEASRYRRLARSLAALADHEEVAPAALREFVDRATAVRSVAVAPVRGSDNTRTIAVVGAVAAAAGTAVVVHMLRARVAA